MAVKIVLTSCFAYLLDCWYILHCFRVIFFYLSFFKSLFNLVYRTCSACRYSSILDCSSLYRGRYSRWRSAFLFSLSATFNYTNIPVITHVMVFSYGIFLLLIA